MHQLGSPTVGASLTEIGAPARRELDADRLLAFVLDCALASLRAFPERTLSNDQWRRWQVLLARRRQGEPFAYLVGHQEFWSLSLEVGAGVLIPRPDSEVLVEAALSHIALDDGGWIADVGTGSGNLALALVSERAKLRVMAIESSPLAMRWAARNVRAHGRGRVHLSHSRSLSAVADSSLLAVVSNPPYIASGDLDLEASTLHEPRTALIAAEEGLAMLRELALEGRRVLRSGGWLMLEHGWKQGGKVLGCLQELGYQQCQTLDDLALRPRVTIGRWIG